MKVPTWYIYTVNFSRFSTFSKFASLYEESFRCDVIILDEIVTFQNQIFKNRKWNYIGNVLNWLPYVSFFLVLLLTLFAADVTIITSSLPQICVFTTPYWLFHVPGRKWWRQLKDQNVFKIYVKTISINLYLKLLYAEFASNWKKYLKC